MTRVVLTRGEEDLILRLPPSTTAFQLKAQWAEKYSLDVQDLHLTTEGRNDDIHDGACISDIAEDPTKVLQLSIKLAEKVHFSVIGSDRVPIQVSVLLSAHPSTEIPKVKEQLAIEKSRPVRLLLDGAPLDASLSFEEQQVTQNSHIEVELGWRVHLKSNWTRDEDLGPVNCFSGDMVRPTLTSCFTGDFQLLHNGKRLDFNDSIGGVLGIPHPKSKIDHTVQLCIPHKIFVMDTDGVREMSVFDGTTVGELGLSFSNALISDAEIMRADRKLTEVVGNTLLRADLCVVVVLSHKEPRKRRRCIVRLSGRATVHDLWSKVMEIERSRSIRLYFQERCLDDFFVELRDLGIKSGSFIFCRKDPVRIKMRTACGKDTTFTAPGVQSVTYSDLMRFHRAKDDRKELSLAFLKGLSFKCNGCGRQILREMDGRQLVPAPCCDVASLDLTAVHHYVDKGAQTSEGSRQQSVALDTHFECHDVKDAASQTELFTEVTLNKDEIHRKDRSVTARPNSTVLFHIYEPNGQVSHWNIESFPTDSLSQLLKRLSEEATINVEGFGFVCQFESGRIEDGRLQYSTLSAESSLNDKEEMEWKRVYTDQSGSEEYDTTISKSIFLTNTHIAKLDDVFYSPGLVPIISIDLQCLFLTLDSSEAFNLIPKNVNALSDPRYVGWIECNFFIDNRGDAPPEILLSSTFNCVNVNSGEVFESREQAKRASRISSQNLCDELCYILLRHNSRLPKWPVAPESLRSIAIREGCDFSIQGGRIQVKKKSAPLSRRWIYPKWNPEVCIPTNSKPHLLVNQIAQFIST